MNFICPHCEQELKCDDDLAGQVLRCPSCNGKLKVPAKPDTGPAATDDADESAPGKAKTGRKARSSKTSGSGATSSAWRPTDSSNVSSALSFGLGLGFMIIFYLATFPIRKLYLGALFWDRGWVPFVEVLFLGWSLAILVLKMRKVRQQRRAMLLDMLPESVGGEIRTDNVDDFLTHLAGLPAKLHGTLIVKRMMLGLQHFQVRGSNPEVANMMMSQSEIDASTINSSYSLLKVFLWAIPILGFIGTVLGISDAIAGFSGSLQAAQDIEVLKSSLNNVTSGLAVAFDTTLVALCMSLVISFPMNAMQKQEEDLLGTVDAYCNENLLKRLNDSGNLSSEPLSGQEGIQALVQSITNVHQNMLSRLGDLQEQMAEVVNQQSEVVDGMGESVQSQLEGMGEAVAAQLNAMNERAEAHQQQLDATLGGVVKPITQAMQELSANGQDVESKAVKMITTSTKAVQSQMGALTEALEKLNAVLTQLGEKQVIIQQEPRRGFSLFGRK